MLRETKIPRSKYGDSYQFVEFVKKMLCKYRQSVT
jgi:hypothetical protein